MLTGTCGTTAVAVSGGGGLWLSMYLGSNLDGWAIAMGAGFVIVVTVAAGIISVDMANIAAAAAAVAEGKTEILRDAKKRRNFFFFFSHVRFGDSPAFRQHDRSKCGWVGRPSLVGGGAYEM